MKKNIRLISILLTAVLVFALAGCGKSGQTLESYAKDHPEVQSEIDSTFSESGFDGAVTIKDNNILMSVDITSLLGEGVTLDDNTKELLSTSFDSAFDESEAELQTAIGQIEEETKIKGVTMQVVITYGDEVVYDRTFAAA